MLGLRLLFSFVALVCAGTSLRADIQTTNSVPSRNQLVLQRIDQILHNIQFTEYSHKTEVDEKIGSYKLDCSGLGRFILRSVAPEALRVLPPEPKLKYQRAVAFYNGFTNMASADIAKHWSAVTRFSEIEPGDFIAWRKVEIEKGDNSGHVLIALEKPVREADGTFRIKLVDSSAGKHAFDSRKKGHSGIGTGVMWFDVDAQERPVAFRWADGSGPMQCPISVGRLK